jgi:RsiW-degrading membrane proteinase PrsW (M82 family)
VLAVVGLLLMAYVVAAGVEESMKHAAVRFTRFPAPFKSPDAVMVYFMAAALGFATAENIEYVFGSSGSGGASPLPGSSLFVGELFVLLMRVCMPVHVICSVLQATNLSRVSYLSCFITTSMCFFFEN